MMHTKHALIIKRDDGSHVKIYIILYIYNDIEYRVDVYYKEKRKRNWKTTFNSDNFQYRKLDSEERRKYADVYYLKYVTREEIQQAKLELWEKLKPT